MPIYSVKLDLRFHVICHRAIGCMIAPMIRQWLRHFLLICALVTAAPSLAHADRERADIIASYADAKLIQAELILKQAVTYWNANPDVGMLWGHLALKGMVNGIPGLRSLIAVAEDGELAFDSYNPTLFSVHLGDREYVQRALSPNAERITIVPVIVGRHSDQPFLPIALKADGGRVIMASFLPGFCYG